MKRILLKFKNEGIKNLFMNDKLIDSIFESNIGSSALANFLTEELEIKNPEYISFIEIPEIKDFIVICEINNLDYIFYIEKENDIYLFSSLYGNVIINNSKIEQKTGVFANINNIDEIKKYCYEIIDREIYYIDIIYCKQE